MQGGKKQIAALARKEDTWLGGTCRFRGEGSIFQVASGRIRVAVHDSSLPLVGRVEAGRAGTACDYFVNNACQPRAHATMLYTKMPDTLLGTGLVSIWARRVEVEFYIAGYVHAHVCPLHG